MDVKDKEILLYNRLDERGFPVGEPTRYKNEVFELKQKKEEDKFDLSAIFDKFCTRAEELKVGKTILTEVSDDDLIF